MNSGIFSNDEEEQLKKYLDQIRDNVNQERLTPVERYKLAEEYKPIDRVPIRLASMEHNAVNINASIKDILLNPSKAILAALSTVATYKSDNVIPYGDSHLIGPPETGAKIEYPENSTAVYVDYPIKSPQDLESLNIPDPATDGNLPLIMETISETANMIGDQVFVMQNCLGPLGYAGDLRGPTQLLMDIVREPEFVHELMDFSTRACIVMAKAIQAAGARPLMWDAMGSPTYSGKKRYMELIWPYESRAVQALKNKGINYAIGDHVDTIIDEYASMGANSIVIEVFKSSSAIKDMKTKVNKRSAIMVHTLMSQDLLYWKPKESEVAIKDIFSACAPGGGFISSIGVVPADAQPKNVHAAMNMVKTIGQYN